MLLSGVVLLALVGVALGYDLTDGKPQPTRPLDVRTLPPRTLAPTDLSATTAYVADASGLVPVSLATGQVGPSIAIPGYDGTANLVAAPNGQTAYVVSLPTPAHPATDESGPALVPVNLLTRRLGQPIDFRATAIQVDSALSQPMFELAGLAITPNGRTVLVADEADHSIIPINVVTRQVGQPIVLPVERTISSLIRAPLSGPSYTPAQPAQFGDIAVNPDGKTAYVSDGYSVIPVSLTRHRALAPITGFDAPSMIAVSPGGRFAYVTNPDCWEEISTGDCIATPRTPVVEPNGKIQLYAGGQFVSVVDLRIEQDRRWHRCGEVLTAHGHCHISLWSRALCHLRPIRSAWEPGSGDQCSHRQGRGSHQRRDPAQSQSRCRRHRGHARRKRGLLELVRRGDRRTVRPGHAARCGHGESGIRYG